ncbi:hypothetical protein [Providencia rustigianii]|uniref:hypothetical protein n=1 Tax=Providencia rustigianii TaxID=158850 RepID=UPI00223EAE00|nr:hypothetical protein [Providencia rustigianii]
MNQLKIDKQKGLYVLTKGLGVFPVGIDLLAKRAKAVAFGLHAGLGAVCTFERNRQLR